MFVEVRAEMAGKLRAEWNDHFYLTAQAKQLRPGQQSTAQQDREQWREVVREVLEDRAGESGDFTDHFAKHNADTSPTSFAWAVHVVSLWHTNYVRFVNHLNFSLRPIV